VSQMPRVGPSLLQLQPGENALKRIMNAGTQGFTHVMRARIATTSIH